MGIRFRCHHCEHELNLKEFQAGRRGRCPACSHRFRVPLESTKFSIPLEEEQSALMASGMATSSSRGHSSGSIPTFELRQSSLDPDLHGSDSAESKGLDAIRRSGRNAADVVAGQSAASQPTKASMPQAVAQAPHSVWYVRPATGGQFGPADAQVFYQWLVDHRVAPDALVWRDGWSEWQVAGQALEDFFGSDWRLGQASEELPAVDPTVDPSAAAPGHETVLSATVPVANVALVRRKKKQKMYGMVIAVLVLLAVILVAVLAGVVMR